MLFFSIKKTVLIALFLFFQHVQHTHVILFFGDSITAGYGLELEKAFPALMESQLNQETRRVKVINAGLSGETSAGGLSRIAWVLREKVDIFVLALGANDGLRGLPLQQTENNLQAIIEYVKGKYPSVKIVLGGMKIPPNLGDEYVNQFQHIYPRLAKKNKAILIPFLLQGVGGNPELNLPDGIHPNIRGHQMIAETVIEKLIPLLNEK